MHYEKYRGITCLAISVPHEILNGFLKNSSVEDTCFIWLIVVSSWISPCFADLLYLASGCFILEGSRIGSAHFALGKGQNIILCEKWENDPEKWMFILCSSLVLMSSALQVWTIWYLGIRYSMSFWKVWVYSVHEENVLDKQREES